MAAIAAILITSLAGSSGTLLVRGRLAAVGAAGATATTEMLVRELLGEAIGSFVKPRSAGRLQVALLSLVLGLLVRAHEVAGAVAIALLCAPDLLLAGLIGVYRLRKGRRGGGKRSAGVLVVAAVTTTTAAAAASAEAKGQIQPVGLLLVVHCGRGSDLRSRGAGASAGGVSCVRSAGGVLWWRRCLEFFLEGFWGLSAVGTGWGMEPRSRRQRGGGDERRSGGESEVLVGREGDGSDLNSGITLKRRVGDASARPRLSDSPRTRAEVHDELHGGKASSLAHQEMGEGESAGSSVFFTWVHTAPLRIEAAHAWLLCCCACAACTP